MIKVIPVDVYDNDGNMVRVEFYDGKGDFAFQVLWDPSDEQTSKNREDFRLYAYRMADQLKYEVNK